MNAQKDYRRAELAIQASAAGCTIRTMYKRQRESKNLEAARKAVQCQDAREIARKCTGILFDQSNWPREFVDVADRDALRDAIASEKRFTPAFRAALLDAFPAVPECHTEGFISRQQLLSQLPSDHIAG